MGEYVTVNNWEELHKVILEKMEKNCLNCKHGGAGEKAGRFVFCTDSIVMIDLTMGQCCPDWEGDEK